MLKFISEFKNKEEENMNIPLIKRQTEEDLVTFVVDIYKSLEVTGFITFLGYDVEYDESKIDTSKYITTRKKIRKQDKDIRYQYIHPDRCIEVTLRFKIHVKGEEANISKSILIPKVDKAGYYTIRDKRYFLLYQLVDNSTYTSRKGITLKSVMPICINKEMDTLKDVEGTVHDVPYYYIDVFKREIESFLFYFAKIGFSNTMKFFTVDNIIKMVEGKPEANDDTYYYFSINKNMSIGVVKYFFDKYLYVQSMVLMVKRACNNKTSLKHMEDTYYWTQRIGGLYTTTSYKLYDSGKSTITFFERLLDITTQSKLKVSKINKLSVYSVVKWIIQNYMELKKKDNLDLDNKRLRLYEYIASLLSKRVNEGINRILTLGSKVKMKQVRDVFKFSGTIIFSLLYINPLTS